MNLKAYAFLAGYMSKSANDSAYNYQTAAMSSNPDNLKNPLTDWDVTRASNARKDALSKQSTQVSGTGAMNNAVQTPTPAATPAPAAATPQVKAPAQSATPRPTPIPQPANAPAKPVPVEPTNNSLRTRNQLLAQG